MWGPNFAYLNIDSISGPDDLLYIQNTYLKPGVHCLSPSFLPWVTLHLFPAAPASEISSLLLPLPVTLFPLRLSQTAETWQGRGPGRITFM